MDKTRSNKTTSNEQLRARRAAAVTPGAVSTHAFSPVKGQGSYVWDVEGKRYLDFSTGIAAMNIGHSHPAVVEAVTKQVKEFQHLCFAVGMHENYIELAERLNALAPGDSKKKSFLVNSGAEAVENTVKIARAVTGRAGIVSFTHAFHGRTFMAFSLTGKANPYKAGFITRAAEVYRALYPYHYRNPWGATTEEETGERALAALKDQVRTTIGVDEVAAFLIEPVAGEGGFIPAPRNFLAGLREFANEIGAFWIDDEVQTGVGRTGKMWAVEHYDLEPDIVASAKGLSSGFPLSAVTAKAEIMDAMPPGSLGSTFGGNVAGVASALATLDVIEREGLLEHAARQGEKIRARLDEFKERFGAIGDVRGLGFMVAMEFVEEDGTTPDAAATQRIVSRADEHGLILLSTGSYSNVVRLLPPLNISDAELDEGLAIIERSLQEVFGDGQAARAVQREPAAAL